MISIDALPSLVDAIYEAGLDAQRWPNTLAQLIATSDAKVADLVMGDASVARPRCSRQAWIPRQSTPTINTMVSSIL